MNDKFPDTHADAHAPQCECAEQLVAYLYGES